MSADLLRWEVFIGTVAHIETNVCVVQGQYVFINNCYLQFSRFLLKSIYFMISVSLNVSVSLRVHFTQ